jgi:aminoglycoside 3-N-acetyltransferase I
MKPPATRRLRQGDHAAYRAMNALFADVFEDRESYADQPPPDSWVSQLLARDDLILLVAEAEGATVGALAAYVLDKFEQARREIYIYDLGVREPWRRTGIATALVADVQAIARQVGAWTIYVQADPQDDPALRLYAGLGTREAVFHFDISPLPR